MKVTRRAKRRWFTPQNHARIRWNTAFSRFSAGVSEAFIESLDVGNKIRDFVQNHLRETFARAVLRPVIHKIIPAMSGRTRRTFESISDPKNAHLFTAEAAVRAFSGPSKPR